MIYLIIIYNYLVLKEGKISLDQIYQLKTLSRIKGQ